jgi:hypothetical protein
MEASLRLLVRWCRRVVGIVLVMAFTVGCQSLSFNPRGHTVPEAKRIALPQSGDYSSTYDNGDFDLAYKLVRNQGQSSISGRLRFDERITYSYYIIRYFHLDLVALDAEGKVLEMIPLTSVGNLNAIFDNSIEFNKTLAFPPNTVAMAFSYTGKACGDGSGDGGDVMDFWEYPLY